MTNHKLKKNQFDAIRAELLDTERARPQALIAADYNTSSTMVSVVNNARTWGNYKAGMKAKHPLRGPVAIIKPTKVEQAKKAGFNPHDREDRQTEKLAFDLQQLEEISARNGVKSDIAMLKERQDASRHNTNVALDAAGRANLTARISLVISLIAFVLSLIGLAN